MTLCLCGEAASHVLPRLQTPARRDQPGAEVPLAARDRRPGPDGGQLLLLRPADRRPRLRPAHSTPAGPWSCRSSPGCTSPTRRWPRRWTSSRGITEEDWPDKLKQYNYRRHPAGRVLPDPGAGAAGRPGRPVQRGPQRADRGPRTIRPLPREKSFLYYGAVRAGRRASSCHPAAENWPPHSDSRRRPQVAALVNPGPATGRPDGRRPHPPAHRTASSPGSTEPRPAHHLRRRHHRSSSWPAATPSSGTSSSSRSST